MDDDDEEGDDGEPSNAYKLADIDDLWSISSLMNNPLWS